VEQINQATKTTWVTVINQAKDRKTKKKEREHAKICLPSLIQ